MSEASPKTAPAEPEPRPAAAAPSGPPAHSSAFRLRRFLNWFPLGLAYAFLYMGRYNLTVAKNALGQVMTKEDFGVIFGAGTLVYGVAFLLNGPLTDKIGGKRAMIVAVLGAAVMNLAMGMYVAGMTAAGGETSDLRLTFSILYAANMYFQSFGAVAIVKVNAHWFHVRERGGFSGIFGTMISSGIFFAFTVNGWILAFVASGPGGQAATAARWVFYLPALLLGAMAAIELLLLKDRPSQAGHEDFETGDASAGDTQDVPVFQIMRRILTNPIILTVAFIEFCTGILRQSVMHWYPIYAKEWLALPSEHYLRDSSPQWLWVAACFALAVVFLLLARKATGRRKAWYLVSGGLVFLAPFLTGGWGGILMVAGVIGGNVAGWVSDVFFQSRRAPAAGGLYAVLALAAGAMYFTLGDTTNRVDWVDNSKAPSGRDRLERGDEILSIAGIDDIERWEDVQRAVACVPAECRDGSQFDTVKCMCTNGAARPHRGPVPESGAIPARVRRHGRVVELALFDPGASMRAGDSRAFKAGPVTTLSPLWLGICVFLMSLCVIGTHGVLSGTATMDFGGRKGAATAVGVIDGFVYLGTAVQSFALGYLTPKSWSYWPLFMVPFAVVGFLLATRIWNAKPSGKGGH